MKVEILSGLWIASFDELGTTKPLIKKQIDHLINCSTTNTDKYILALNEKYKTKIKYVNLPINDEPENIKKNSLLLIDNMNDITELIHNNLKSNKNVMIICNSGIQSSYTIAVCYLMRYGRIDIDYAVSSLLSKNNNLDHTTNKYNYCIKQYYINLKKK